MVREPGDQLCQGMLIMRVDHRAPLTIFDKVQTGAGVYGGNQGQTARGCFQEDYSIGICERGKDEYVGRSVVSWQFVLIDKARKAYPADTQGLNEPLQLGFLRA